MLRSVLFITCAGKLKFRALLDLLRLNGPSRPGKLTLSAREALEGTKSEPIH
jgi:hypothetical protein